MADGEMSAEVESQSDDLAALVPPTSRRTFLALMAGSAAAAAISGRADAIAPGLFAMQFVGRWGNFFNQELYGPPTTLPWGIAIECDKRLRVLHRNRHCPKRLVPRDRNRPGGSLAGHTHRDHSTGVYRLRA